MKYLVYFVVLIMTSFSSAYASMDNGLPFHGDLYIKLIESTDNEDLKLILKVLLYKEIYDGIRSHDADARERTEYYYPDSLREDFAKKEVLLRELLDQYNPGLPVNP